MVGGPERHHVVVTHGLVEIEQCAGGGRVDNRCLDRIACKRPYDVERSPQADDGHLDRAPIVALEQHRAFASVDRLQFRSDHGSKVARVLVGALPGRARTPDSRDHGSMLYGDPSEVVRACA